MATGSCDPVSQWEENTELWDRHLLRALMAQAMKTEVPVWTRSSWLASFVLLRTPQSVHHPHNSHDEHRQSNHGGGVYFAVLLGLTIRTPPPQTQSSIVLDRKFVVVVVYGWWFPSLWRFPGVYSAKFNCGSKHSDRPFKTHRADAKNLKIEENRCQDRGKIEEDRFPQCAVFGNFMTIHFCFFLGGWTPWASIAWCLGKKKPRKTTQNTKDF